MLEKATVLRIDDDVITLACGDSEGCSSCAAHGFCSAGEKTFEAWNRKGFNMAQGSVVEVYLPTGKTIGAAFMVMIFPLILFFILFKAAGVFLNDPGEGARVLFGLIGIAAGFGINFLLNRRNEKRNMPVVTGVLSSADGYEKG